MIRLLVSLLLMLSAPVALAPAEAPPADAALPAPAAVHDETAAKTSGGGA